MYICLCHALTERDVLRAAREGARRARDVYDSCDGHARCGSCGSAIHCLLRRFMMEREQEAAAALPAPAA